MARARSRGGQSAVDDLRVAYDEAPYESYAHPNLHLDNLPRWRGRSDWIHATSPAPGCSKSVVRLQAT